VSFVLFYLFVLVLICCAAVANAGGAAKVLSGKSTAAISDESWRTSFVAPSSLELKEPQAQAIRLGNYFENMPTLAIQTTQAISEPIPQPIYSYTTVVNEKIKGQSTTLPQMNVPAGKSLDESIAKLPAQAIESSMSQPSGKNMPIINAPGAENLPVKELQKQHVFYPVKEQEEQSESFTAPVLQPIRAPHLQRIVRHRVPVRHIHMTRTVQPVLNREVLPMFQTITEEGAPLPAVVAQPKGH